MKFVYKNRTTTKSST